MGLFGQEIKPYECCLVQYSLMYDGLQLASVTHRDLSSP